MRLPVVHAAEFLVGHNPSPDTSGLPVLPFVAVAVGAALLVWFALTLRARAAVPARRASTGRDSRPPRVASTLRAEQFGRSTATTKLAPPPARQWPVEVLLGVAALSGGAGVIHAAVTGEHFDESLAYGWFFVMAAVAQCGWPVWLLRSGSRQALAVGLVGNLAIVALWVVSRTLGLPVGPEAGEPEAVGALDPLATVYEVGIVAGCAAVLRGRSPGPVRLLTGTLRTTAFASVVALATLAVLWARSRQ